MVNIEDVFAEDATTTRTLGNIKKALRSSLERKYGDTKNKEELREIEEEILKIHGLHKTNFDFISKVESMIKGHLNDNSIDDNSNKNEKTIQGIMNEASNAVSKAVGYDYLYRTMVDLYGKKEAKRLSGELYDYSLAISDSTKMLIPYCWAFDASKIVLEGRPFGQLQSKPPKSVMSYTNALVETIHQMSSHLAGAIAISSFFFDYTHLVLYKEKRTLEDLKTDGAYRKYIENNIQSFVHSVNHLSRGGVECFTPEVEVLTIYGFKKYNEVKAGDNVYTWNDGKMEVQPIDKVNVYNYDGEMHRYCGRDLDKTVTPNHRVIHKINNSKEYKVSHSKDIINNKTPLTIPISFKEYDKEDFLIQDEMIELIVILINDGCFSDNRISITKSPSRYGAKRIEHLLAELEIEYQKQERSSKFGVKGLSSKYKDKLYKTFSYRIKGDVSEIKKYITHKKTLPEWFMQLSKRQAQLVLNTWRKFDGHGDWCSNSKIKLQCDNLEIADQLQQLCVIAGYGTTITSRKIGFNKKETIYVYVRKRPNKDCSKKEKIQYKGIVWCPTTKNGILMFRDKHKNTFVSGNSPFSNISIFDDVKIRGFIKDMDYYFNPKHYGNYDYDEEYIVNTVKEIQDIYMDFFDKGDPSQDGLVYRFPVSTINISKTDDGNIEDRKFLTYITSKDIFRYNIFVSSGSKLASCCRLLSDSEMLDFAGQSNSFGGGGAMSLGSHRVVTINFNRIALDVAGKEDEYFEALSSKLVDTISILKAHKELIQTLTESGLQQFINRGWINMSRMFSTVGLLGIVEAADTVSKKSKTDKDAFIKRVLVYVNERVKELGAEEGLIVNLEQIPAESMSHRLPKVDKMIYGEKSIKYPLYANQFIPLWEDVSVWDRIEKDGIFNQLITGGGIVHFPLGEKTTKTQNKKLIDFAVETGCEHFALNPVYSICEKDHVNFGNSKVCPKCGSKIVSKITRTVGFFTPVEDWTEKKRDYDFERRNYNGV